MWKTVVFISAILAPTSCEMPTEIQFSYLKNIYGDKFVQSSTCGGIIKGLAAGINYKLEENITRYENCAWTLLVEPKETIEIRIVEEKWNAGCSNCNFVYIYDVDPNTWVAGGKDGLLRPVLTLKPGDRNKYTLKAQSLFTIVFGALGSTFSPTSGFSLIAEAVGQDAPGVPYGYLYKIFDQLGGNNGVINFNKNISESRYEIASLTIHPEDGKRIALSIDSFVANSYATSNVSPCTNDKGTIFIHQVGSFFSADNFALIRYRTCTSTTPTDDRTTIYSRSPLVVRFKTTANLPVPEIFQISWRMQ